MRTKVLGTIGARARAQGQLFMRMITGNFLGAYIHEMKLDCAGMVHENGVRVRSHEQYCGVCAQAWVHIHLLFYDQGYVPRHTTRFVCTHPPTDELLCVRLVEKMRAHARIFGHADDTVDVCQRHQ